MSTLDDYRGKRDFQRSGEPRGASDERVGADAPAFVIHKHAASQLHFDLRLEEGGVLRSWALPKGPSLKAGDKRLAVAVEDHPLDYADFEGTIPKGQYGGGTVMIWDAGHWRETSKRRADRIDFELVGEKLTGRWTLARMGGKAGEHGKNWLLIKRRDKTETIANPDEHDVSVASGRTMDEIAQGATAATTDEDAREIDPGALAGARKRGLARAPRPRLASLSAQAPVGDDWLHEIKFDGYRILARLHKATAQLLTRNGKDWSDRFVAIRGAVEALPVDSALLDGEVVALDCEGISRFGALQEAIARRRTDRLVYQVFDLLHLDGNDLKKVALIERKRLLADVLEHAGAKSRLRYTDHVRGQGAAFFDQAGAIGLEGIISKRVDSAYSGGRSKQWRKIKIGHGAEFVVGGFTEPEGARAGFGSLLLGAYDAHDRFVYAGRVGTGFSARQIESLHAALAEIETDTRPFAEPMPDSTGAHWVQPTLVVDVAFTERTRAGVLRHPNFRGLREDRDAATIRWRDRLNTLASGRTADDLPDRLPAKKTTGDARSHGGKTIKLEGVRLTHPDRVVFPETGIRKRDLAHYYVAMADWILPGLAGRPLSLLRCPGGLTGDCFFQKHPRDGVPARIPRSDIAEDNDTRATYVYVNSAADLVGLVQVGAVEFHPWGSRNDTIEKPDRLVFDLDPASDVEWREVIRVAHTLRERLESLGLVPFLRLTGGKGLHLVVPITRHSSWDEAKAFARAVCRVHARGDRKRLTANMSKAKRRGRIYLDYLRNGRGATAIASYSTRARPGAPVAVPIRWDELEPARGPDHYDMQAVIKRLNALAQDPWEGFGAAARRLTRATREAAENP